MRSSRKGSRRSSAISSQPSPISNARRSSPSTAWPNGAPMAASCRKPRPTRHSFVTGRNSTLVEQTPIIRPEEPGDHSLVYGLHASAFPSPAEADLVERLRQDGDARSEEHTSELQSRQYLVCRLLLEKKKH